MVDTVVSGAQSIANGGSPGLVLGAIGVSLALNAMIPTPNIENLGAQIGMSAARGAFISASTTATMGGDGRDIGASAAWGAGMGGLGGFAGSQQAQNWSDGYGFQPNNDVIDGLNHSGKYQESIDYAAGRYGFPTGKYDSNDPVFIRRPTTFGYTDPGTGEVIFGPLAFAARSNLQATGFHEGVHVSQFKSGRVIRDANGYIKNIYTLEVDAGKQTLNNASRLNLTDQAIREERAYYKDNSRMLALYGEGS